MLWRFLLSHGHLKHERIETFMEKLTVIAGASTNSDRYAYKAAISLQEHGFEFIPIGIKKGQVAGKVILDIRQKPVLPDIHTLTIYIGSKNQESYMNYFLSLTPKRIIFNPGAENPVLEEKAKALGIETVNGCTLVMLSIGAF
jgi:predicted CoA-binding protein